MEDDDDRNHIGKAPFGPLHLSEIQNLLPSLKHKAAIFRLACHLHVTLQSEYLSRWYLSSAAATESPGTKVSEEHERNCKSVEV